VRPLGVGASGVWVWGLLGDVLGGWFGVGSAGWKRGGETNWCQPASATQSPQYDQTAIYTIHSHQHSQSYHHSLTPPPNTYSIHNHQTPNSWAARKPAAYLSAGISNSAPLHLLSRPPQLGVGWGVGLGAAGWRMCWGTLLGGVAARAGVRQSVWSLGRTLLGNRQAVGCKVRCCSFNFNCLGLQRDSLNHLIEQ